MSDIAVTRELVEKLAKSARLSLSQEEVSKFTQQLSTILNAFKELDQVDTVDVEPSYHPIELEGGLRCDEPVKWDWDPLANVDDVEGKNMRGPKIK